MTSRMTASKARLRARASPSLAVAGERDVVARLREQGAHHVAHDLFVVDDEDRLGVHRRPLPSGAPHGRQRHLEGRALSGRAFHEDGAAVLLDDAVGDGEAETGAAANPLRGEERIVDALDVLAP